MYLPVNYSLNQSLNEKDSCFIHLNKHRPLLTNGKLVGNIIKIKIINQY